MLTRDQEHSANEQITEDQARRRVQSIIRGWLTHLEELPGWTRIPPIVMHKVRRALVRTAWSAYRVGLLTPYNPDNDER
jgi:hypothetical protein